MKIKLRSLLVVSVTAILMILVFSAGGFGRPVHADPNPTGAKPVYDISQWQGHISDQQAAQLKNETSFVILRAQYGGLYTDSTFNHNASEMSRNGIPYGVYDYSLYSNDAQAAAEARNLYQRAPQASFYVNDSEENRAGANLDSATAAWANEIHSLTNRPAVLYSYLGFMPNFSKATRNAYNAIWLADYGPEPNPDYHYDLWQYTDDHYSNALGEDVDASTFPDNSDKPLSFWTGNGSNSAAVVQPSSQSNERRPRRIRSNRGTVSINHNYYRSRHVHFVEVTAPHGIRLYTLYGKRYLGRIQRGAILWISHFKTVYSHRYGYLNRAVGYHFGRNVIFTANKHFVHWFR